MKKLFVLLTVFAAGLLHSYAQDEPVRLEYDDLLSKYEKSNKVIANPKKNMDPKVWFERGKLFMDISNVNIQYMGSGLPLASVKNIYGEQPKSVTKSADGKMDVYEYPRIKINLINGKVVSWEETSNIVPDPLSEAITAFTKCDSLDIARKYTIDIKKFYRAIVIKYRINAALCVKKGDQNCTLENFKKVCSVNASKLDTFDLKYYYNVGLTATDLQRLDEATEYYQFAADKKYKDSTLYYTLKTLYYNKKTKEDSAKALRTINQGLELYPEDANLLTAIVYHYIYSGEKAKAVEYIAKAKTKDPNNKIFYYIEGAYYAQINDMEKAVACYIKALEIDPNYFNPTLRMGEYYLFQAEELYKIADKEKDPKKFEEKKAPAIELYKKAVTYYEKAVELKPSVNELKSNLKRIYIRLGMTDKVQQMNKK